MIGRGGIGAVYKAHQKSLDRTVALKITSSEIYATEAQAAAHLDHPGIVPVFQVGNDSGRHFFTMGFVNGMSLEQMLKRGGPFKPKDAALTTAAIAGAIHYAHTRGVIHRDIKPANALIDDQGRPRVVDFGLAQRIRIGDAQTESDVIVGTPEYISPEVANGNPATPLSDVYSIGAMLYSLLVGRPPFTGIDIFDVLRRVRRYHPVPPRKANKSIPRDLETICLKCLAKYPPARYANAEELALDLTRWLNGVPILARHRTRLERTYRLIRNNLLVTAALLVALIGICFAIGATLTNLIAEPGRPLITQAPGTRERTPEESPQPISDPHVLAKAIPLLQKDHPAAASAALIQMARLWPVQEPLPPDLSNLPVTLPAASCCHVPIALSVPSRSAMTPHSPLSALTDDSPSGSLSTLPLHGPNASRLPSKPLSPPPPSTTEERGCAPPRRTTESLLAVSFPTSIRQLSPFRTWAAPCQDSCMLACPFLDR